MTHDRKLDLSPRPGWVQAVPFALVFSLFFLLPLAASSSSSASGTTTTTR